MDKYSAKEAINSLIEKLELPKHSINSQDWEYEVSDLSRVKELMMKNLF